ncbi:MAG: transposase [Candidatus Atabeyarchaeum deiterrae]
MLRTSTALLRPTQCVEAKLREYAEQSATLWNTANYERRRANHQHAKMPSYAGQCKALKDTEAFRKLGTCKAQALLAKLDEAWRSYYALLRLKKSGKLPPHIRSVAPPRYRKRNGKRETTVFYVRNDGWSANVNEISMGRGTRVPYRCGDLWVGKQGRLEVWRDEFSRNWYAHVPVEVPWEPPSRIDACRKASLDVGVCNLAALHMEGERPTIFSGRAVLSDWVYHTKKIASRQSNLPWGRHTSKHIGLQFRMRQRRLRHAIYAMARTIFLLLEEKGFGELYVGDLNGIRRQPTRGRRVDQKVHNFWAFDLIWRRLVELGEEYGIAVRKVPERGTSRTCCLCGKQHGSRVKRGLTVCHEMHRSLNADVNGAVNLLKVAVNRFPSSLIQGAGGGDTSGSGLMAEPLLLRWNYHEWVMKSQREARIPHRSWVGVSNSNTKKVVKAE